MTRLFSGLILVAVTGLISARQEEYPERFWQDPVVHETRLFPEPGSDVYLEEARLQILAAGLRVVSFRVNLKPPLGQRFVLLVDPLKSSYRTVVYSPGEDGEASQEEIFRLRSEFGPIDWERLPSFQQIGMKRGAPSRGPRANKRPAGMIWAEAQPAPEPFRGPTGEEQFVECQDQAGVSIRSLDENFSLLVQTSANLTESSGGLHHLLEGTCLARRSGLDRQGWHVSRCEPLAERAKGAGAGRFASFFSRGVSPASRPGTILQFARISPESGGTLDNSGFFALGDDSKASHLILGAVAEGLRACPGR